MGTGVRNPVEQPYSMCPVLKSACDVGSSSRGGFLALDPELALRLPKYVRRSA